MKGQEKTEDLTPIGEVSVSLGLTTRTLRYWEEMGIIESAPRADGATRGYTPYFVRRIKFILKLKELGLSIKEMQDLYTVYGEAKQTGKMIPRLIDILDDHINTIDSKIANLASLRNEIVSYRQRMANRISKTA